MDRHAGGRGATAAALALALGLLGAATPAAAPQRVAITVLATNDLHRHLTPPEETPGRGGVAHLATHLDRVRDRAPDALYVDAGDMTGSGNGVAAAFHDEPMVEAMGLVGLDVSGVGNHEFDDGIDELRRQRDGGCRDDDCTYRADAGWTGATFATVGANVYDDRTARSVFPPWVIRPVGGVDVGVVGVTSTRGIRHDDTIGTVPPQEAVNPAVAEVVAAGADVVVVLSHVGSWQGTYGPQDPNACERMGGPAWWARQDYHPAVDVVVDGHTHSPYVCDPDDGPLMTQAGPGGSLFTEITLVYDPASGDVVERSAVNRPVTHDVDPEPAVLELVDRYGDLLSVDAPAGADRDGDGLGDGHEVMISHTDPRDPDTDGDGLDDGAEVTVHQTDPNWRDTDWGGVGDAAEVAAGTDPRLFVDDLLVGLQRTLPGPTWLRLDP